MEYCETVINVHDAVAKFHPEDRGLESFDRGDDSEMGEDFRFSMGTLKKLILNQILCPCARRMDKVSQYSIDNFRTSTQIYLNFT